MRQSARAWAGPWAWLWAMTWARALALTLAVALASAALASERASRAHMGAETVQLQHCHLHKRTLGTCKGRGSNTTLRMRNRLRNTRHSLFRTRPLSCN